VPVAGLDIEVSSLRQAVGEVSRMLGDGQIHHIVTVNVDQSLNARDDEETKRAFRAAKRRFADGAPIVAAARFRGVRLPGRVTGADLLPALCAYASRHGCRVAFVGGAPGVPEEAARRLGLRYSGLNVVCALSPPFAFDQNRSVDAEVVRTLRDARPDIVFVCLGSPKQELWVHRRVESLPPGVYLGVGAAIDFAAGSAVRAPAAFQAVGMEWLFRLLTDWRRLWRRYLVRDLRFVALAVRSVARELRGCVSERPRRRVRGGGSRPGAGTPPVAPSDDVTGAAAGAALRPPARERPGSTRDAASGRGDGTAGL